MTFCWENGHMSVALTQRRDTGKDTGASRDPFDIDWVAYRYVSCQ